jgi:ferredoxin
MLVDPSGNRTVGSNSPDPKQGRVLILVEGAQNVPPPTEDELETVRMCTDADARLGCQLVVNGDIVVTHLE